MLYALLTSLVCSAVIVICLVGINDRQRRAHARREDLLLNQLLHAVGKTWEEPPVRELGDLEQKAIKFEKETREARSRLQASPEQLAPIA